MPAFQQLNLTKCSSSSLSSGSLASAPILPHKLLFAQPSMQAAQTQMEAEAMDEWFTRQTEAKQKEVPKNTINQQHMWFFDARAILKPNNCFILSLMIIIMKPKLLISCFKVLDLFIHFDYLIDSANTGTWIIISFHFIDCSLWIKNMAVRFQI